MGRVHRALGDYTQALAYFNQALVTARAMPEKVVQADVLNSVGLLYLEQRDYAKAALYLRQALDIHRTTSDTRQVALELQNLGITEYRQGYYEPALKLLTTSYRLYEQMNFRDGLIAAGAGLGTVARLQGDFRTAQMWLDKSFKLAETAQDPTRTAEILWQQAETWLAAGNLTLAQATAGKSFEIAGRYRLSNLFYLSATILGKTYLAQQDYEHAAFYFEQAIRYIEAARTQVAGAEQESAAFFDDKVEPYHNLAVTLLAQNRATAALLVAERAKGRVLFDVVREGRPSLERFLTTSERSELLRQRREVSTLTEQLQHNAPDATQPKEELAARLDAARLTYEAYQNDLSAAHPEARLQRGTARPLVLSDLKALPQTDKTAYLEYLVTGDKVYLFVVRPQAEEQPPQVRVYPINIKAKTLAQQADQFRQRLATRSPAALATARVLYDLLIQPAAPQLAGVTTLGIVPDGCLWNVPFQALLGADGRYVLENFALHYAPSLAVLREITLPAKQLPRPPAASLLALGNPLLAEDAKSSLPDAENEVTLLAQVVGSDNCRVLTGAQASEARFKASAASYRTLHLATHGVLDNEHPLYSYLRLAHTPGDEENDGHLEAREIMALRLDADLAVLSACDTANGHINAGEGVIGLSWAFFIAGCRTTVVSQWRVNSESTAQLMAQFYRARQAGQNNAAALRTAALAIMQDKRYRQPFYWVGFIVVGSN